MKLRDYQIDISKRGYEILLKYGLLYLAMQTRTGKTLTALTICNNFKSVLFLTKKKAIPSIQKDYTQSGYKFNITVINYESVHKTEGEFDVVVCDEAHALGQYPKPSNRAKNIKKIIIEKPVIYLSATPAPESWSQLYHQFWISSNSQWKEFKSFYKWSHEYVNIKKKYIYNRELNDYSDANKEKIWSEIKHLFITKTQEEAGFSIQVDERILYANTPQTIRSAIKSIMKDNVYMEEGYEVIADTAAKVMNKVHQLCSGTVIDEIGYRVVDDFKGKFLSQWGQGKKLAIFYKFQSEKQILMNHFDNYTDDFSVFQSSNNSTFIGQFQSAREGIRLDTADAIVFFNIDYSYLSYEQARNRIASFERKEKAVLYWLFSDCGIEKRIYKAVKNKSDYTLKFFRDDRELIRAEMEQESSLPRLASD